MTENDNEIAPGDVDKDVKPSGSRTARSIRFFDSEWERIEFAAEERGLSAAEYVRFVALDLAAGSATSAPETLSPVLGPLIESTYRAVYLLATLKRHELLSEGREEEVDDVLKHARISQSELLSDE